MSKLSFTYDAGPEANRQAYRASIKGLMAQAVVTRDVYAVHDISAGGISLRDTRGSLKPGDTLAIDIQLNGRVLIAGLAAEVARRHEDVAGLRFKDLSRRMEERLDKLVLEVQKYLITKSKTCGCHIDDEHTT